MMQKEEQPLLEEINITINNRVTRFHAFSTLTQRDSDLGAKDKRLLVTALILRSVSFLFQNGIPRRKPFAAHCDRHNLRFQETVCMMM